MKYIQILPQLAALFFFPAMMVVATLAIIYEKVIYPILKWLKGYRPGSSWWSMSFKVHLCIYAPVLACVVIAYLLQKHTEGTWLEAYEQYLILAENICIGIFSGAAIYWFTGYYPVFKRKADCYRTYQLEMSELRRATRFEDIHFDIKLDDKGVKKAKEMEGMSDEIPSHYLKYFMDAYNTKIDSGVIDAKLEMCERLKIVYDHLDFGVVKSLLQIERVCKGISEYTASIDHQKERLKIPQYREALVNFDKNAYQNWFSNEDQFSQAKIDNNALINFSKDSKDNQSIKDAAYLDLYFFKSLRLSYIKLFEERVKFSRLYNEKIEPIVRH